MTAQISLIVTSELREPAVRQWSDYRQPTPGTYFSKDHRALNLRQAYAGQVEVARL
jgi:hypothetical protein